MRTRSDREHLAKLEQEVARLRGRAEETDSPYLREVHERNAEKMQRIADHARRRPVGVGMPFWIFCVVAFPAVAVREVGGGWWGLLLSAAVLMALVRRRRSRNARRLPG